MLYIIHFDFIILSVCSQIIELLGVWLNRQNILKHTVQDGNEVIQKGNEHVYQGIYLHIYIYIQTERGNTLYMYITDIEKKGVNIQMNHQNSPQGDMII